MKPVRRLRSCAAMIALLATLVVSLNAAPGLEAAPDRGPEERQSRFGIPPALHGLVLQDGAPSPAEWEEIGRAQVGVIRFAIPWHAIESRRGHYRWELTDDLVRRAVGSGAQVIPFVWGTPAWVNANPGQPPLGKVSLPAWRKFLTALVSRYKPGSRFWRRGSSHGIQAWQIWNEVNHDHYWKPRPAPEGYARLVQISSHTIRQVSPRAEIVLSGLSPASSWVPPLTYLERLLKVRGFGGSYDSVGLHPYSHGIKDFVAQVRGARSLLDRIGRAGVPIRITEFGWGSAGPPGMARAGGYSEQARMLARAYRQIAKNPEWGVKSASWYGWRDSRGSLAHCSFCSSIGVRHARGGAKPAWSKLKRSIRAHRAGKLGRRPSR